VTETDDRTDIWLPLLKQLSEQSPTWLVYKNADSALHGTGDVDATAAPDEWGAISKTFRAWGGAYGPTAACSHIPGGLNLIVAPTDMDTVLEMGMKLRKSYRGSTLFSWDQLVPLATWDERGFRELRHGAEGLLKLILNGIKRDGSKNEELFAPKRIVDNLSSDIEGVHVAAEALLSNQGARAAVRLADAAVSGGWDRRAARRIQRAAYLSALIRPGFALERARFSRQRLTVCPVTTVLLGGQRKIPADRGVWWNRVVETHPMEADPS